MIRLTATRDQLAEEIKQLEALSENRNEDITVQERKLGRYNYAINYLKDLAAKQAKEHATHSAAECNME